MHPQFLEVLCCPRSGAPLELRAFETQPDGRVYSGEFVEPSGRCYPVVRGIPRFVSEEEYAASFGYEWTRWPRLQFESENVGRPMAGHTTRMWEINTQANAHDVQGKTIVEFGCGPGRFLDVVRRKGGRAVGIDISLAVEAARQNFADDPEVLIVQGDILRPPFREGAFDGAYSIGVLHHTPDPAGGVVSMMRTVKPGGWVAVSVYPKGEFYDYRSIARFRQWQARLGVPWGRRLALAYAYFSAYLLSPAFSILRRISGPSALINYLDRNWLVLLRLPDTRWAALDIFDTITPAIATTHTGDEVRAWLTQAGCAHVQPTAWSKASMVAVKANG